MKVIVYSCNPKKNIKCKKTGCYINGGCCKHTTKFKYAKKTPLNLIKNLFNIIKRGTSNE